MNLQLSSVALLGADVLKSLNPQSPQARAIFNLGIVTAIVLASFSRSFSSSSLESSFMRSCAFAGAKANRTRISSPATKRSRSSGRRFRA